LALSRVLGCAAILLAGTGSAQVLERVGSVPRQVRPLPVAISGRVQQTASEAGSLYVRQWPGSYFDTRFRGREVLFQVGTGEVSLRVTVDGGAPLPLVKPAAGFYRVSGLAAGDHRLRVQVVSESQKEPTSFGGFYAPPGTKLLPPARPVRQIEFIGDSHTVGYGNSAGKRDCSQDEVWATTDTSRGIAGLTASHYGAAYQVNAISGRGIVRNYNGFAADPLPQAYPYVLFDKAGRYRDATWQPQLIVIALGTNDFSTPLNSGEKWKTRDQLHADYEQTYARFVRDLRARNRGAFFLLWATDMADGEIAAEVGKVARALQQSGERRIAFVPITGLRFGGCHFHPDLADDKKISAALAAVIDKHPELWRRN